MFTVTPSYIRSVVSSLVLATGVCGQPDVEEFEVVSMAVNDCALVYRRDRGVLEALFEAEGAPQVMELLQPADSREQDRPSTLWASDSVYIWSDQRRSFVVFDGAWRLLPDVGQSFDSARFAVVGRRGPVFSGGMASIILRLEQASGDDAISLVQVSGDGSVVTRQLPDVKGRVIDWSRGDEVTYLVTQGIDGRAILAAQDAGPAQAIGVPTPELGVSRLAVCDRYALLCVQRQTASPQFRTANGGPPSNMSAEERQDYSWARFGGVDIVSTKVGDEGRVVAQLDGVMMPAASSRGNVAALGPYDLRVYEVVQGDDGGADGMRLIAKFMSPYANDDAPPTYLSTPVWSDDGRYVAATLGGRFGPDSVTIVVDVDERRFSLHRLFLATELTWAPNKRLPVAVAKRPSAFRALVEGL